MSDAAASSGTYVYNQDWREERRRLDGMEALWDPGTKRAIADLAIAPGWRCLEVGAGGGSIACWLAEQVGPSGEVLASDLSTRYLVELDTAALPALEIREHDILIDPLPPDYFDLVHARLVVEHLGLPALARMASVLRPGGWIVIEDYSFCSSGVQPPSPLMDKVTAAILGFMARSGFDPEFGPRIVHELESLGLVETGADARARIYRGGSPGTAFGKLSLESLRQVLVAEGLLSDAEIDQGLTGIDDPSSLFTSPLMIAGWGRRPLGGYAGAAPADQLAAGA